jgi:hypothetical protein
VLRVGTVRKAEDCERQNERRANRPNPPAEPLQHLPHHGSGRRRVCQAVGVGLFPRRIIAGTIFLAVRNREFRKFLAGAFFVSGGIQFYLYFAGVSVPLLGTGFVQTPELSRTRAIVHMVLFAITLYFGFVKKARKSS